jgi:hypothetical protein
MADMFDTTKYRRIEGQPYVSKGVVNKAGAIDTSLISNITGAARLGLDIAYEWDKKDTLKEAEQEALGLTQSYLDQSPSEQIYLAERQREIQSELSQTQDSEALTALKNELTSINERLINAKAQGTITPYEFSRRVASANMDLAQANPAFKEEITQVMTQTLNRAGINDVISQDAKMAKAAVDAEAKRIEHIYTTVEPYMLDARGRPVDEVLQVYSKVQSNLVRTQEINTLIQGVKAGNEYNSYNLLETINEDGGLSRYQSTAYFRTSTAINAIMAREDLDFNSRKIMAQQVLQNHRNEYDAVIRTLPLEDKGVSRFVTTMDAMFTRLETHLTDTLTLKDYKEFVVNEAKISETEVSKRFYDSVGMTPDIIKSMSELANSYKAIKGTGSLYSDEMEKVVRGTIDKLGSLNSGELTDSEDSFVNKNSYDMFVANTIKNINTATVPEINSNLTINHLQMVNEKDINTDKKKKLNTYDNVLLAISFLPQESFDTLMLNEKAGLVLNNSVRQFNQYIKNTFARFNEENPDIEETIGIDKERGRLESTNPVVTSELKRLNAYIRLKAKLLNKQPKDVYVDVLKTDFSFLEFTGI